MRVSRKSESLVVKEGSLFNKIEKIITTKKVICIVLVIMMLFSNFVTPITILAEATNESVVENAIMSNNEDSTNMTAGTSIGEGKEKASTTSSDKVENEEANNSTNQEFEGKETANTSNEDENKGKGSLIEAGTQTNEKSELFNSKNQTSVNSESLDERNGKNSGSSDEKNGKYSTSSNEKSSESNNTNNSDKLKSDTETNLLNTTSNQQNTEDLKDRMKPVTKEDIANGNITVKTKNDDYEIRQFSMQFVSGAKEDKNGNLVWTPENSDEGHEFLFRVNYALSGLYELPAEAMKITIPKSILRNRAGNSDDNYIMSLPTIEEYDGTTELAYIENEDYIIVFNPDETYAGINGYFEIAYATKSKTLNYKDYDETKTDTVLNGGTASDPFGAIITIKAGDDTLAGVSNEKKVYMDTTAKITSTQKRYPTLYKTWNEGWMEQTPDNINKYYNEKDQYYYLVWEISSYIQNPTQKYNFKLEDVVTDLTEGTSLTDETGKLNYELVGYKLAGEKYYSDKNTQTEETRLGSRYDYVLTRHKKDTYKDIEYTLKNTITATVEAMDKVDKATSATSSNIFNWDPTFTRPTGNFNLYKSGGYINYDLDKLQKGEVNELKGFRYTIETRGYAYPWTLKEGGSLDNPEDYGVNPVTYDTCDDTLYLDSDTDPMDYEDYYIDYFTYGITNYDAHYEDGDNKFTEISPTYKDNETITFYGKFNGGEDWVQIGTYNLETKVLEPNNEYVQEMTTSRITFKDGVHCTGWRFTTSNKHYYTNISVTPYITITNSDYIKEKIADKDSIIIRNYANIKIANKKDNEENIIFEKEASAQNRARVTYYSSSVTKNVSSISNDRASRKYTINWKINAWERATSGNGTSEYIPQESGRIYDLIPLGGELDVNSIQVQTEAGYLESNEYTYEIIANYNNSGRSMLVINIDAQADFYTVYYKTVYSWESIQDYGRIVLNPVAYETGNEKIANGYADNGGNLSPGNKELFTDLDSTTDSNKFIYTEHTHNINIATAAASGLYKKVKNSKESEYTYNTEIEPNGSYSYQLRYQNTFLNKAKNLVFFDSLENFEVKDSEAGETKTSSWKGELQSVDLTQLKKKGIDAVLYISTVEKLNLEEHNDLTDKSIWTKAAMFTDLSKATAIAIDMTKDTSGNDYILNTGESVAAVVHMKAPGEVTEEIEKNPYTYNNIYIKNTLIDELEGTMDYFIHQDYTTVKYHVVADVPFYKVSSKNKNYGIKGITFRLYGTSKYGTEVDEYVTSNKNGLVNFKEIEAGEYILQEYEATSDWIEDHTEHTVEITNKKKVYIDGELVTDILPIKIQNTPRIHTDVTFYKKDLADKNKALEGVKFKLEGTSDYGNEVLMYALSDSDGKVTFENIEKGKYTLVEISTIDGYILNGTAYRVLVDENGNADIQKPEIKVVETNTGVTKTEETKTEEARAEEAKAEEAQAEETKEETKVEETKTEEARAGETQAKESKTRATKTTSTRESYESIYDNGNYYIYNEPYHSFYFIKKDAYSYENLGGAKFKLYGCSNTGNTYDETRASVEGTGYVTFENLESGTYVLKEIEAPNTEDVTYVLDPTSHIVEVFEDGKVTLDGTAIWPLSEINDEPYKWYNTRNKGQITVTKKWVDNKTNEERKEPVIYISTKKPEEVYPKAYFRTASSSSSIIDYVTTSAEVTSFRRNTTLSEADVIKKPGVQRLDNDYNNENEEYKIYGWIENGTLYWWSKADFVVLPANLDYYFNNESSLKEISWTGIYKNGYWKGTVGSEELTESITNMRNMFYNCSSIENLNISWFNNTQIATRANMEYAFGNNYSSTPAGKMSALKYITIGENFKLFDTSVLTKGTWKNQKTGAQYANTSLIGTLAPGTYEYMGITVKYAVQIYGIQQDKDSSGNTLGLTFGPATGANSTNGNLSANYNNSYVTHTYEDNGDGTYKVVIVRHNVKSDGTETTEASYLKDSSGSNVTRTSEEKEKYDINIHDMTWAEISAQSQSDPAVFRDAMLCGDTKSVQISLNGTLSSGTVQTAYGDGAGVLSSTINSYYREWNPSRSENSAAINGGSYGSNAKTAGGYSSSHMRATLVGENEKTDITYAGDVNATASTSLYSCIEGDLQSVIANKAVKYVTGSSSSSASVSTVSDPIWLFSRAEMCISTDSGYNLEGTADSAPMAYQKFNDTQSVAFVSTSSSSSSTNARVVSSNSAWWLRSPDFANTDGVCYIRHNGQLRQLLLWYRYCYPQI